MTSDDIGAATKALAEAVSALSKSMSRGLSELGRDVNAQVAGSLRAASEELSEVSVMVGKVGDTTSRKRSAQTRVRLIEAASKLFAKKGYEAASLGDVATEAGFTKGAVYANFAGKEDLLLAVAKTLAEQDQRWLAENAGRPVAEALSEFNGTGDDIGQRLMIEIALYAARHPEVRQQLADLLNPDVIGVARLIATERGGDPNDPSEIDLDTAIGVVAIRTYVQLVAPAIGDLRAREASKRLISRLLSDPAP